MGDLIFLYFYFHLNIFLCWVCGCSRMWFLCRVERDWRVFERRSPPPSFPSHFCISFCFCCISINLLKCICVRTERVRERDWRVFERERGGRHLLLFLHRANTKLFYICAFLFWFYLYLYLNLNMYFHVHFWKRRTSPTSSLLKNKLHFCLDIYFSVRKIGGTRVLTVCIWDGNYSFLTKLTPYICVFVQLIQSMRAVYLW